MITTSEQGRAMAARRKPENLRKTKINNPEGKAARATKALELKVQGKTRQQAAKILDISIDTLDKDRKWAEQNGVFQAHEQRIVEDLTPLALNALSEAMQEGNVRAALGVLQTFIKLSDREEVQRQLLGKANLDYQSWMLKRALKASESDREAGAIEAEAVVRELEDAEND